MFPRLPKRLLPATLLLLGCVLLSPVASAKNPEPPLRIPLEPLGFQVAPSRYLLSGGTMFTVNFVDDMHLLLTFNTRGLLTRTAEDEPDDEPRNVTALLLELPSGRVVARTQWRTHDHDQYLWPLTHGRFLLRIRNSVRVIAPLAHLASPDPFEQQPFLVSKRRIALMALTPNADLLTIESVPPPPAKPAPGSTGAAASQNAAPADDARDADVQINFYRILADTDAAQPIFPNAIAAGVVRADGLMVLPLTAEGSLAVARDGDRGYLFDFHTYTGEKKELAAVETTCTPRAYFVSRSEFLAYSCRGADDRISLGAFNMKGEQMWTQNLSSGLRMPYLPTAPAAGRFAMSRVLVSSPGIDIQTIQAEQLTGQEVVVTQTWNGAELLRLQASPIQRAGQNFDLSNDGLSLAVLRGGNVEVYRLPALSDQDQAAVAQAQALAPKPTLVNVRLTRTAAVEQTAAFEVPSGSGISPILASPATASGDADPNQRRQAPTLYAPGEKPQK